MIKIIDYKAGNAPSVLSAVKHLGFVAEMAQKPEDLTNASHIILPGVGAASETMTSLGEMNMITAMHDAVFNRGVYFLGICVGMQILFEHSEENDVDCLGWLKGTVKKFDDSNVKVPQMGWNKVTFTDDSLDYFYFVNSYYVCPTDESIIWGTTDYNGLFTAAIKKDNIFAAQFHAEKSGRAGLSLLNTFLTKTKGGK